MKSHKLKSEFIKLTPKTRLYNIPCPIIGLTGGIATGKSTVSKLLEDSHHHIICADKLVKDVYKLPKILASLDEEFPGIVNHGEVDFKKLRELVFSNPETKAKIENLIYKEMPEMFLKHFNKLKNPNFIFYDVPLLFEKGLDTKVDLKLLVYCPREIQVQRLVKRDSISTELAEKILSNQIDIDDKRKRSDFIIDNSKELKDIILPNFLWE